MTNNFDLARLAGNTGNTGYFGAGIYFSEVANVAAGYTRGRVNKVLLCKLLLGREYKIGGTDPYVTASSPPSRPPHQRTHNPAACG